MTVLHLTCTGHVIFLCTKMGPVLFFVFNSLVLTAACFKVVNSEHRIILVGHDEQGKNSAGNIILGKEVFKKNANGVHACQCEESEVDKEEHISLINTPGPNVEKDTVKCVVIHSFPGPHAFLLVLNVKDRSRSEEKTAVKWIEDNFGSDALMYTILLFTHTEQLQGKSLDEYIRESAHLKYLRYKFGGRYHAFNSQLKGRSLVSELLQKIEVMVKENGGKHFSHDLYEQTKRKLEEQLNYITALAPYFPRRQDSDVESVSETDKLKCKEYLKTKLHYILDLIYWFFSLFMPKWMSDYMSDFFGFNTHCSLSCLYEIFKDLLKKWQ